MNYLQELSKTELITGIGLILTFILFVAGALEKLFGVKSIGTLFCSFVWKLAKRVYSWARNEQFKLISEQLTVIQKEVTPNGGGSIKDVVNSIKSQSEQHWTAMMGLHDFTRELSVRMDIADEADNRMSFKLGSDKCCVYVSPSFLRFFGYAPGDVLGTQHLNFCTADGHKRTARASWKEAFESRKPCGFEQIIVGSNANRHLCLVRGFPLENKDGKLTGYYGTVEVLDSFDD